MCMYVYVCVPMLYTNNTSDRIALKPAVKYKYFCKLHTYTQMCVCERCVCVCMYICARVCVCVSVCVHVGTPRMLFHNISLIN